jgi:hypothetical protein
MTPADEFIREFFALREQVARLEEQLSSANFALNAATSALEHRLIGMNEFREQLNRERGMYVLQNAYDDRHAELARRIAALEIYRANIDGRFWMLGTVWMIITFTAMVVMHYWR